MNSNENSKLIFQTDYGISEKNKITEMDYNNTHQCCLNNQMQTNKQKLLDFISDKNKLILKTYFDQKGSKDFLLKKNKALERIELNTSLENEECEKHKSNSKHKNKIRKKTTHKSPKHKRNIKSLYKENSKESFGIQNPTKKKKNKQMSSLNLNKFTINGTKNKNNVEEESTGVNKILGSKTQKGFMIPKFNSKIKNSVKNKKTNKLDENDNNDTQLSFNSDCSVDSTFFKNKKDYEKFKIFMEKEDSLITKIITELESNVN
jgi:hypothetical protein